MSIGGFFLITWLVITPPFRGCVKISMQTIKQSYWRLDTGHWTLKPTHTSLPVNHGAFLIMQSGQYGKPHAVGRR